MGDDQALKRTPLYACHLAAGARMVEFGGWEMPVQYTGILDEHQAVRAGAGLFDISHMGEVLVRGPGALDYLQHLVTQDVATIAAGQSNYALLCRPDGGIVDDIFIYHLPEQPSAYLVVVNASNTEKDFAWMLDHVGGFDVELTNASARYAMLALQGPGAEAILGTLASVDPATIPFHGVCQGDLLGSTPALIARTGYTGEDGFELFVDAAAGAPLWDALLAAGAKPCGLGARDSLRFEACLALYGHEIADDVNPYEARLGWVVKLGKGDFVGREALARIKQEGTARRLVGFEMVGRGIARGGYPIQTLDGERVGIVTTGMPSPTLGRNLGLGFVPAELAGEGAQIDVVVREKPIRAQVIKTPFYKPRYKK